MKNAFLIHGSESGPHRNWMPWAKSELEKLSYKVICPQFPTPEDQTLTNWLAVLNPYLPELNSESILIGHSLGGPVILNILEQAKVKVKAAFIVAGFYGMINSPKYDPLIETFSDRNFNWTKIKSNCEKFFVFHSDTDNIVPYDKGVELCNALGTEIILVPNMGHMGTAAKCFELPILLDKVKILK